MPLRRKCGKCARRMSAIACFTFDNMGEAAEIGAGTLLGPLSGSVHPSIAKGYPALLDLLERYDTRATFFLEGWNGVHHPAAVAEVVQRGHEVGMHGWVHETWHELDADTEQELATRATDALASAAGVEPRGFRAPGGARTPVTAKVLSSLGYDYDASLGDGMRPQRLQPNLAQVPFSWPLVDGYYYYRPKPLTPEVLRDTWLAELERVAENGGLFLSICHAFLTGLDSERMAAFETVLKAACADSRVRIVTAGELAEAVLAKRVSID